MVRRRHRPEHGLTVDPHPSPKWDFVGTGTSGTYECSLGLAAEPTVYAPCTLAVHRSVRSMDDTNPAGNNYRFIVRDAANTAVSDTALFKVGPFDPTWNVDAVDLPGDGPPGHDDHRHQPVR